MTILVAYNETKPCFRSKRSFSLAGNCTVYVLQGDSGGPLVCRVDGEYQQVGVVSWVSPECNTKFPSVFTRIATFKPWIKAVSGV